MSKKPRLKWGPMPGSQSGERLCLGPWELGNIVPNATGDKYYPLLSVPLSMPRDKWVELPRPPAGGYLYAEAKRVVEDKTYDFFKIVGLGDCIPNPRGETEPETIHPLSNAKRRMTL